MADPQDHDASLDGPDPSEDFASEQDAASIEPQRERIRTPRHDGAEFDRIRDFAVDAARLCHDRHATDICLLDVRGISQICDLILIATGTSDRQIRSLAGELEDLAEQHGMSRFASESDPPSKWVALDFVDVLAHLFEPATRSFYDLEMLWGDGIPVPWQRPTPGSAPGTTPGTTPGTPGQGPCEASAKQGSTPGNPGMISGNQPGAEGSADSDDAQASDPDQPESDDRGQG